MPPSKHGFGPLMKFHCDNVNPWSVCGSTMPLATKKQSLLLISFSRTGFLANGKTRPLGTIADHARLKASAQGGGLAYSEVA
jgi:hypothetical protein